MEKTLLDTVTLSSGTLAQSPVARQPFMGKLMSVAPLAGSLWMLRTVRGGGRGEGRDSDRQRETETERFQGKELWPWDGKLGGTVTGLLLAQNRRSVRGATQPHHARGVQGVHGCTGRRAFGCTGYRAVSI